MDLFQAMRLYTRIVDLGSFTRAAEQLELPRASATQIIKQLEAHLGVRLLQRTTRQVTPTLDGSAYYQRCLAILTDVDDTEAYFSQAARHPKGKLKIDMPISLGRQIVIPALPVFCERYPLIELDISMEDRQIDIVREGVDCVLRAGELRDSSLVVRRLKALEQASCASPSYLAKYGIPQTLEALAAHRAVNYVSSSTGRIMPFEFMVDGQLKTLELASALTINNAEGYVTACVAGFGLAQIPRYNIEEQLADGRLVELLPQYPPPGFPLAVLYPHHRHLSPRLRVFVDWLAELFTG